MVASIQTPPSDSLINTEMKMPTKKFRTHTSFLEGGWGEHSYGQQITRCHIAFKFNCVPDSTDREYVCFLTNTKLGAVFAQKELF